MIKGTLLVIEGLDGSGKGTQTALLQQTLESQGIPCKTLTFPNYASPMAEPVKQYLAGAFGGDPAEVNPYACASFYAIDRFASYVEDWREDYEKGTVLLCDRYVTSNLIYQLAKVEDKDRLAFLQWAEDYEYEKLGLPRPTATFYLDVPLAVSQALLQKRYAGDESKKDIHESSMAYLARCRESAKFSAKVCQWQWLTCCHQGKLKSKEQIHQALQTLAEACLFDR